MVKSAFIQKIKMIQPIDASSELAIIGDELSVAIGIGEFQIDDLCVHCELPSGDHVLYPLSILAYHDVMLFNEGMSVADYDMRVLG